MCEAIAGRQRAMWKSRGCSGTIRNTGQIPTLKCYSDRMTIAWNTPMIRSGGHSRTLDSGKGSHRGMLELDGAYSGLSIVTAMESPFWNALYPTSRLRSNHHKGDHRRAPLCRSSLGRVGEHPPGIHVEVQPLKTSQKLAMHLDRIEILKQVRVKVLCQIRSCQEP